MSTRIRYERTENPEVVVSVRIFSNNSSSYRVRLNTNSLVYCIEDANNPQITINSGTAVSLSQLKIKAKSALNALGIHFENESRDRGTVNAEPVAHL